MKRVQSQVATTVLYRSYSPRLNIFGILLIVIFIFLFFSTLPAVTGWKIDVPNFLLQHRTAGEHRYFFFVSPPVILLGCALGLLRHYVAFDLETRTVRKWSRFLLWDIFKEKHPLKGFQSIVLAPRSEEADFQLGKGKYRTKMMVVNYYLIFKGKRTLELAKFGGGLISGWSRRKGNRLGRELSGILGMPFVEKIATPTESEKKKIISRSDVEAVLKNWAEGKITSEEVQEWSDEHHVDDGWRYDDCDFEAWERNQAESVTNQILVVMSEIDKRGLTSKDAPVFLKFLKTPMDDFDAGFKKFKTGLAAEAGVK